MSDSFQFYFYRVVLMYSKKFTNVGCISFSQLTYKVLIKIFKMLHKIFDLTNKYRNVKYKITIWDEW